MNSKTPKVLHQVCGLPMVEHVGRAMKQAGVEKPVLVYGHGGDQILKAFEGNYQFAHQSEQLGTGHAVSVALPLLEGSDGPILIAPGDAPLVTSAVFTELVEKQRACGAACVVAVCELENPTGYGRVVRDEHWNVRAIVEESDATDDQKQIREVNGAFYCFSAAALRKYLPQIKSSNTKNEQYLTDIVELMTQNGEVVETYTSPDHDLLHGVNDRWQLAEVSAIMQRKLLKKIALSGVTIIDPGSTVVGCDVVIGPDSVLLPGSCLEGTTEIGADCTIGPHTRIVDSKIGDRSEVTMSQVNRATIGADCRVGPFANVRPHSSIGNRVKVGNYVEIKAASIGDSVSLAHLSYVGDATIGTGSNIGAGTITCNFDGFDKHRTEIGENVFVGSNSTLVAPLRIESGAFIAAGSVITEDVPVDTMALGRSRQVNKPGWAQRWRESKSKEAE
ncbi:MAG: bifunctional UDP-N-acetylglucosamine diphosphorylase/glucosamine-1-phosphate N-acetyltransferase GlmU [Fimbriimonadales bacterium]